MSDDIKWDASSGAGKIPKKDLQGSYWSVFRLPAGYCLGVFGKPVTPEALRRLLSEDDEK